MLKFINMNSYDRVRKNLHFKVKYQEVLLIKTLFINK